MTLIGGKSIRSSSSGTSQHAVSSKGSDTSWVGQEVKPSASGSLASGGAVTPGAEAAPVKTTP
jgi:hypothetical protein